MFTKSQRFYDAIYGRKDYEREAQALIALVDRFRRGRAETLLDVGCGTGAHLPFLRERFKVEGVDLDAGMLEVARARNPGVPFQLGDMVALDLGRQFDVVVSLFSAIGYAHTVERLKQAVESMARHVAPHGLLLVEPFFSPDHWLPGRHVQVVYVDEPDLKIARMVTPQRSGNQARFDFHYLVGTPDGVEHFTERHEIGLFSPEVYERAFTCLGFDVVHDPSWPTKRGLFIARMP